MKREQICKQQIHCLSCMLSVLRTGKECYSLTEKEIEKIKQKEQINYARNNQDKQS